VNVVSIRTTENYEFDKIRTVGVTGNATNYKNSQGDNPVCSTRDEISQPSRPFSPRAAIASEQYLVLDFGFNLNRLFIKTVVASLVNIFNMCAVFLYSTTSNFL